MWPPEESLFKLVPAFHPLSSRFELRSLDLAAISLSHLAGLNVSPRSFPFLQSFQVLSHKQTVTDMQTFTDLVSGVRQLGGFARFRGSARASPCKPQSFSDLGPGSLDV